MPIEHERRATIFLVPEYDSNGNILESPSKDVVLQIPAPSDNPHPRSRMHESVDSQRLKMPLPVANNFYKSVSENKDIAKLISQLATCINTTKKVFIRSSI